MTLTGAVLTPILEEDVFVVPDGSHLGCPQSDRETAEATGEGVRLSRTQQKSPSSDLGAPA